MKRWKINDIVDVQFDGEPDNRWYRGTVTDINKDRLFFNGYKHHKATGYTVKIDEAFPEDVGDYLFEYRDLHEPDDSHFILKTEIVCNEWIPCTDENYWAEKEGYVTIVKYQWEDWDDKTDITTTHTNVYTQHDCPYGWNVLCKSNSYLMNIKL